MKTILVPLDGSRLAEQVLPHVLFLAPLLDARVHLLNIVPEMQPFDLLLEGTAGLPYSDGTIATVERVRTLSERYMEGQAATLRDHGIEVDIEIHVGSPADDIVLVAERDNADLIALATHGYSGIRRWTLGSVTDKVVHAAHVPVLVVRAGSIAQPAWNIESIMVPLDGSPLARQALPPAADLAVLAHASLVPITVVAPPVLADVTAVAQFNEALAPLKEQLAEELSGVSDDLKVNQVNVTPVVARGMPAATIVEQANEQKASLIVMATHGASGLRRWALGSTTDSVLHLSHVPVLVVRAQAEPAGEGFRFRTGEQVSAAVAP